MFLAYSNFNVSPIRKVLLPCFPLQEKQRNNTMRETKL